MFSQLSERINHSLQKLSGRGRITEANIQQSLKEVRKALLEADVALPVVKQFINEVRGRAVGSAVMRSLTPGQALIQIVHEELVKVLGEFSEHLNLAANPPVVVLMAGLQGSGKTTTVAKLAHRLKNREKKNVMVASADIYRPGAIAQLETLAEQAGVAFYPSSEKDKPLAIAKGAYDAAKRQVVDVLILDTAGRLHIDDDMMAEIKQLHGALSPTETLFVVDSMMGQDAATTAKAFHEALPLTGVILTKTDGDARGGAALSIRHITGKPVKFMGVGEKIEALEAFHPDRVASRILGMGDVMTLIEEAQDKLDHKKSEKIAKKLAKGKRFTLDDFLVQLQQMKQMGGVGSLMEKLPGMGQIPDAVKSQVDDKEFVKMESMILSMTKTERKRPDIINSSRKRRIAAGSGRSLPEVNKLLKQFTMMQKMFKKLSGKGGMMKMMGQMKNLKGMMPDGGGFPPQS